ncbi:MAG: 50S ribosomal protein L13 [bacterium]|nr:50S ribosomal protein L13 [bacterium]
MAIKRKRVELDAAGQAPGRLATKIATTLIGKNKPGYVAHIDSGDRVIILNASQIFFTGKKLQKKVYRHHSMHPGGLKEIPAKKMMEDPEKLILQTVIKMLPKNKLRAGRMNRISFK